MKNKFLLAVGLMFGMATLPLKAQVKIGFINADYILSQMPEAKQVEEDLKILKSSMRLFTKEK